MRSSRSKTEVDPVPLNRQRVTNPYNLLLPVNNFGTTHVGIYMPGLRLPMRFRNLDMISASQYFPLCGIMLCPRTSKSAGCAGWQILLPGNLCLFSFGRIPVLLFV